MTAFVLTDPQGQIKDRDMLDLYDGYLELALDVKMFKEFDVITNPQLITKNDIFGGHVSICRQIWKNNKVKEPELDCYPAELKNFLGRHITKTTLKGFTKILEENENHGITFFVKPIKNKIFTGYTCMVPQDLHKLSCSKNIEVYVSTFVKFDAEFRAYIFNGKIIDVFRYWGDRWDVHINKNIIENMVSLLKNMPCFYSLDVGIDDKGRTLLVEVNDGYALGNYGLGPKQYAEMTLARCKEINNG
jgi:hypothetical protein